MAEAAGFVVENLSDELHALRGKCLRIAQPYDEQCFRAEAACGRRREQERLAQFAAEQIGLADAVKQAVELLVHFGQ